MMSLKKTITTAAAVILAAENVFAIPVEAKRDFKIISTASKPDAIYKSGEKIVLKTKVLENGKAPQNCFLAVTHYINGKAGKEKIIPGDKEFSAEFKLDKPGWVRIEAKLLNAEKQPILKSRRNKTFVSGGIGAMVEPEKIQPGLPAPADFNDFWKKQRERLNKVPLKAVSKQVELNKKYAEKYVCFDVKVDCAGLSSAKPVPVSGYLVMPKGAKMKSLPALVMFHGAGVYTSYKRFGYNAIVFDVNAHGIENGKPAKFYKDLYSTGALKNYRWDGAESRDTCYFLGMYLRVMRALDYVKSLPEWNGKVLAVFGASQGGAQSIAAAALDPQVTFCFAGVPAMSDHGGCMAGRASGWPGFYQCSNGKPTNVKRMKTALYFDNCYFARNIKCEIRINTGFFDTTCPPTSVFAVYNALPPTTKKTMLTNPTGGHSTPDHPSHKRLKQILK